MTPIASHRLRESLAAVETMTRLLLLFSLSLSASIPFLVCVVFSMARPSGLFRSHHLLRVGFSRNLRVLVVDGAILPARDLPFYPLRNVSSDGGWLRDDPGYVQLANAAALAGSVSLEEHLVKTVPDHTGNVGQAHHNALAAKSLLPDFQRVKERFT